MASTALIGPPAPVEGLLSGVSVIGRLIKCHRRRYTFSMRWQRTAAVRVQYLSRRRRHTSWSAPGPRLNGGGGGGGGRRRGRKGERRGDGGPQTSSLDSPDLLLLCRRQAQPSVTERSPGKAPRVDERSQANAPKEGGTDATLPPSQHHRGKRSRRGGPSGWPTRCHLFSDADALGLE